MKHIILLIITSLIISFQSYSHPRTKYRGKRHTTSHGGRYFKGKGSSHKGGHYRNYRTKHRYGSHRHSR